MVGCLVLTYLKSILPKTTSKDSKLDDNMDVLSDTMFYFIIFCLFHLHCEVNTHFSTNDSILCAQTNPNLMLALHFKYNMAKHLIKNKTIICIQYLFIFYFLMQYLKL